MTDKSKYGKRGKIVVESKTCTHCKQLKPADKFPPNTQTRDGLSSWCGVCNSATEKQRRLTRDPRDNSRRDFANNLRKHKLSVQEFATMWLRSDGLCENPGCNRALDLDNRIWAVDHDRSCCPQDDHCEHCTRGLLCPNCNTALGLLGESEECARGLMRYLLMCRSTSTQT